MEQVVCVCWGVERGDGNGLRAEEGAENVEGRGLSRGCRCTHRSLSACFSKSTI